jgi:hypothetical protein
VRRLYFLIGLTFFLLGLFPIFLILSHYFGLSWVASAETLLSPHSFALLDQTIIAACLTLLSYPALLFLTGIHLLKGRIPKGKAVPIILLLMVICLIVAGAGIYLGAKECQVGHDGLCFLENPMLVLPSCLVFFVLYIFLRSVGPEGK